MSQPPIELRKDNTDTLDIDNRRVFEDCYWVQGEYVPRDNHDLTKRELSRARAMEARLAYALVRQGDGTTRKHLVYNYMYAHACVRAIKKHNEIVAKARMLRDPANFDPSEIPK